MADSTAKPMNQLDLGVSKLESSPIKQNKFKLLEIEYSIFFEIYILLV